MPPIYATSTYAQASPGVHQGFEYSRTHNPTRFAYERCVAGPEGGSRGFALASGMAATATALDLPDSGEHVTTVDAMNRWEARRAGRECGSVGQFRWEQD